MLPLKCSEIIKLVEGQGEGPSDLSIINLNRIEFAKKGDLTFYHDPRYREVFEVTEATCVLIPADLQAVPRENQCFIKVANPYHAFIRIIKFIDYQDIKNKSGIHPTVVFGRDCVIEDNVYIGPNCYIGDNCKVGEGSVIEANCVLMENTRLGTNNILYPNVTCYKDTEIGSDCIIHSGAVIGSDGFGYLENKIDGSFEKIPQIGNVRIGDNVEIGANSAIDRAVVGSTIIQSGVKIDNLVQIGHNCFIDENTALAGQSGVAGTTNVGKRARIGGQAGLAGHIDIGDDIVIGAQSGVSKSLKEKGVYFGSPAQAAGKAFRVEAALRKLPEVISDIGKINKKLSGKDS